MEVGTDFAEYLQSQIKKFKSAIMREYLRYRRNPETESGFPFFKIATDYFYKQKHFEVVIEDCVRRYLVNGFLGRLLEARGNGIYPPRTPEKLENTFVHITNNEFEELVTWEFCGDFQNNKRQAIRYTNIPFPESAVTDDIDEIIIINWKVLGHIEGQDKVCRKHIAGKPVVEYSLRAFLYENGFSVNEYNSYLLALSSVVTDAIDFVGIRSTPKLTSSALAEFRFTLEDTFLKQINDWEKYQKTEVDLLKTNPEMVKDFAWAYHIIETDNKAKYSKLESRSKELLFNSGALKIFVNKQYYLALIGRSDFAKSFETSEYLYRQHDSEDYIDYTSIISGYLKSVEQLLYRIVMLSINRNCLIKKKGGDRYSKTDFTTDNLDNCDTTLGSLIHFLKGNEGVLRVEPKYNNWVFSCLMTYANECRNESFHKHIINRWSRVEFVRQNTFFIYVILLGCCRLAASDDATDKYLGIVRDDRMERAFNWIINIPQEKFYLEFWEDEEPVQVKFGKRNEFPDFDNYGFIRDYMFLLECPEQIDPVVNKPTFTFIKRDRVPEQMWYIDNDGKRVDF